MLETIAIILIVLWLLGMVSGYTMGNFIYVLLVIAVVTVPGATRQRPTRSVTEGIAGLQGEPPCNPAIHRF